MYHLNTVSPWQCALHRVTHTALRLMESAIELVLFKHQYANIYNGFGILLRKIDINIGIPYYQFYRIFYAFKNFSLVSVAAAQ